MKRLQAGHFRISLYCPDFAICHKRFTIFSGIDFFMTERETALPLHDGHTQKNPNLFLFLFNGILHFGHINISVWEY